MSTIKDCIPLFHSLSVTEQRYNALYVDNRCCFLQLINRIIFLICGLRGCCLRDAAQGAIPIQEEHRAMKNYSLAKKALCANKAESIDLFVSAYFARRAQLPSSLDPSLLSQALAQDLHAAGVQAETISEIQAKIEPEMTAPFLPNPLAPPILPTAPPISDEPRRLAAELMTTFVQAGKKVEALSTPINDYLHALHKHLQGKEVSLENFRSYYQHINQDLHNAYRESNRTAPDAPSPDHDKLYIGYADYFSFKLHIVKKIYLDETMKPDQLFFALFSSEWNDIIPPVTLESLFRVHDPLSQFSFNVMHMFSALGDAYRFIATRIHPTHEPIRTKDAHHFADLALSHILAQTAKKHVDTYQAWLTSDKQTRLRDTSPWATEEGDLEVEEVARILPLFQKPFDSLSQEEYALIDALMHKILYTNREDSDGKHPPFIIFNEEVEKIARIVLDLEIDTTLLSEKEYQALTSIQDKRVAASQRSFERSHLVWQPRDAREIAQAVFHLRRVLLDLSKDSLSKADIQMIESLIKILSN